MSVRDSQGNEYYKGQVVGMTCSNHYDDSWYYAIVFDGKSVEHVLYDSTVFANYGFCEIDASEETMQAYKRFLNIKAKWGRRNYLVSHAVGTGFHYTVIGKLYKVYEDDLDAFLKCLTLLKTKKFRSNFRKSLCEQLREWLEDECPQYSRPFSNKQVCYL